MTQQNYINQLLVLARLIVNPTRDNAQAFDDLELCQHLTTKERVTPTGFSHSYQRVLLVSLQELCRGVEEAKAIYRVIIKYVHSRRLQKSSLIEAKTDSAAIINKRLLDDLKEKQRGVVALFTEHGQEPPTLLL